MYCMSNEYVCSFANLYAFIFKRLPLLLQIFRHCANCIAQSMHLFDGAFFRSNFVNDISLFRTAISIRGMLQEIIHHLSLSSKKQVLLSIHGINNVDDTHLAAQSRFFISIRGGIVV